MKKIKLLLLLALFLSVLTNSNAQKDRALTKGFSVNAVIGFPSLAYGAEEDVDSEFAYGSMFGLKLGSRWYFNSSDKFGIGLMANWLDVSVALKTKTDWSRATIDFSMLEVGPVGTIAITDDIAIDAYYNLRPTIFSSATVISGTVDETYGFAGFGISHALGAAFRWKVLNVGVEYVTGTIKCAGTTVVTSDIEDSKLKVNNFRILLGAKF